MITTDDDADKMRSKGTAVDIPTDSVEYNVRMAIEEIDRLRAENEKIREFARTLLKQIRGDDAES